MSLIRTFVEVAIPDTTPMVPVLDDLRKVDGIRVSPISQMHITLAFVGDVDERKVPKMVDCITSAVEGIGPFEVTVGGTGRFPARGRPNVVWVGAGPVDRLTALAEAVRHGLDSARVDYDDKPFKAHITIGRCNGATDVDGFISSHGDDLLSFDCSAIRLMRSDLSPKGAKHTVLARIPL